MNKKIPWEYKKTIMPQHTDHAGVMWHGSYLNLLEESRIKALEQTGLDYAELLNRNFELPVSSLTIKYIEPVYINDEININSIFELTKGPRISIHSKFITKNKSISKEADIYLVLIRKDDFSIVRKRPKYIEEAFKRLSEGPKK